MFGAVFASPEHRLFGPNIGEFEPGKPVGAIIGMEGIVSIHVIGTLPYLLDVLTSFRQCRKGLVLDWPFAFLLAFDPIWLSFAWHLFPLTAETGFDLRPFVPLVTNVASMLVLLKEIEHDFCRIVLVVDGQS